MTKALIPRRILVALGVVVALAGCHAASAPDAVTRLTVGDTTFLIVDNVVREGVVLEAASTDPSVQGVRRLVAYLGQARAVSAVALQTVAGKGYDGFILARVIGPNASA